MVPSVCAVPHSPISSHSMRALQQSHTHHADTRCASQLLSPLHMQLCAGQPLMFSSKLLVPWTKPETAGFD